MLRWDRIVILLKKLGNNKILVGKNFIKTQCLFGYKHSDGKDSNPSFVIDRRGFYFCFACHSSGRFEDLLKEDIEEVNFSLENVFIEGLMLLEHSNKSEQYVIYDIDFNNYDYLLKRGIREDICKLFEVGFDKRNNRVVFTCRDQFGNFVGFQGRSINNRKPKYIDYNSGLRDHIYRLDLAKIFDSVILVEGFIDVMNLYQHGYLNVVCALGTKLTALQMKELKDIGVKELYVFFDNDQAGRDGFAKIAEYWEGTCKFIEFNKDPAEATEDELDEVLSGVSMIY